MKLNIDFIYPIGSIYATTNTTSPNVLFGGTWERYAEGRCLVGYQSSDSDFGTIGKTGGSKYLQAHTHAKNRSFYSYSDLSAGIPDALFYSGTKHIEARDVTAGDVSGVQTGNSGNLQPYIVVYYWRRTA